MTYIVDAWLERRIPRLRVLDGGTGQVLALIEGDRVNEAFNGFDILPGDLLKGDVLARTRIAIGLISEIKSG